MVTEKHQETMPIAFQNDPVYVIGNPRSGTSLLRLMLTCHPEIVIPPEGHFFLWLEEKFGEMSFPEAAVNFIDELYVTRKFETWGVEKKFLQSLFAKHVPRTFCDAVALVYCSYGLSRGRDSFTFWGDKNKLWKEKLHRVPTYFPTAKYIHIVRDGRDVACSFKELAERKMSEIKYGPQMPEEINAIAERWKTNITFIQKFLEKLDKSQHVTVRYEDLIAFPRQTLTSLTQFLHLEFSESMLDYARRNKDEQLEPEATMHWKRKLNGELDKQNVGKFHDLLTKLEVSAFEGRCKELLSQYGYK